MTKPDVPAVIPLGTKLSPVDAFRALCRGRRCVFLDSAASDARLGRHSFVAVDPFETFECRVDDRDSLDGLDAKLRRFDAVRVPELPPLQGGAIGLFSYDLARQIEEIPHPGVDEFQVPAISLGFYDVVVAFDHLTGQAWIVSQGLPEQDPEARRRRAWHRADQMTHWLEDHDSSPPLRDVSEALTVETVLAERLAPQYRADGLEYLTSSFSRGAYLDAVARAIEYIRAGDVFQVNLAQRLLLPQREDSVDLYLRLRARNPAPFAGYCDLGAVQIVSASPERFLAVRDRRVETRPIKGTRRRDEDPGRDAQEAAELLASEKDRAENVMIVDLMRNDLSRVCLPESVRVAQLCRVESYRYVHHLVSAVRGTLAQGQGLIDLLRTSFPGGSITGAPKIRAMEIIAELEPTARGPYCGSLGYLGFDGSADLSILIRTITAGRGWLQFPVGGGVVAQSTPELEYEKRPGTKPWGCSKPWRRKPDA